MVACRAPVRVGRSLRGHQRLRAGGERIPQAARFPAPPPHCFPVPLAGAGSTPFLHHPCACHAVLQVEWVCQHSVSRAAHAAPTLPPCAAWHARRRASRASRCAPTAALHAPPAAPACRSYVPLANIDLIDGLLPKTCDEAATPELRANCRRCCGLKDRDTCLFRGVAQTWNEGQGEAAAGVQLHTGAQLGDTACCMQLLGCARLDPGSGCGRQRRRRRAPSTRPLARGAVLTHRPAELQLVFSSLLLIFLSFLFLFADVQSCNWMSYTPTQEKVREVYYRLG